jgi:hypothetical protein
VVNRNGLLTGKLHFDGTNLMQQLLENGIVVVNNQIVDLDSVLGLRSEWSSKLFFDYKSVELDK